MERPDVTRAIFEVLRTPEAPSLWTTAELDEAAVSLCDDTPPPGMAACWRALEYCRQYTPHGTPASLQAAMRHALRTDVAKPLDFPAAA